MNYIELINNFWRLNKEHSFTPNEKAVYFALLNKCNELMWKNPFNQSSEYLAMDSGMSVSAMQKARNILKQLELIDFKAGDGRRNNTIYTLKDIEKGNLKGDFKNNLSNTLYSTLSNTLSGENRTNNNKHKTKQEEIKKNIVYDYVRAKDILLSKQISIENLAMQNKISTDEVKLKVNDFIIQKETLEENWENDEEILKNFVFWLPKNLKKEKAEEESYSGSGKRSVF